MPVKSRRRAREAALRALYQIDLVGTGAREALESLDLFAEISDEQREYAEAVVAEVLRNRESIDLAIASKLQDWTMDRLAPLDRNILRIATYELHYRPDVPPAVSLNEAIELAKKYGTADSGKFVNGVLAGVLSESPKASWRPAEDGSEAEEIVEPEPEAIEVEQVEEGALDEAELARAIPWTVRSESESQ